jgi:carboxylesterase
VSSTEPAAGARAAPVDPGPFDLPGAGPAAALCLHGLTGTPYEVRPVGEALAAAGVRAVGPWMTGHDGSPEELARVPGEAWVEGARARLRELRAEHETVYAVGLSMGGLVTLMLATEEPLEAAACIGTPLALRQPLPVLLPVVRHFMPFVGKKGGSDIRDPAARARHPSMPVMPLAAVHQLMRLQRRVRAALPRVEVPLLVAHGAHDATADPGDAGRIYDAVGSAERRRLVLEDSGHVVPVDHDGPELARAVVDFLLRERAGAV